MSRLACVASEVAVASGLVVASGLAPRWSAQRSRFFWGRFAAQRGASPLATGNLLSDEFDRGCA